MGTSTHREVEHTIRVGAPAADIYRLIEDVGNWPSLFSPTIHTEYLERAGGSERIQLWAMANGQVKTWVSRRVLDPATQRIDFRQEVPASPVAAMGGSWLIEPISPHESQVRLLHDYRAVDDDPHDLAWIDQAVDRNSRSELAALKSQVELMTGAEEILFSFEDSIRTSGKAQDVYDFLNEAQLWQERLPHVARVVLTENTPGIQILEMDTKTGDGSTHTTKSVRVGFAPYRLVYKQITLPALMSLHTGEWLITEAGDGSGELVVTSRHTVAVNQANIGQVLGADAGLADARSFIRTALGRNSLTTLTHAGRYAASQS